MPERGKSELIPAMPHDEFSERALIGAMLIDNRYVNEVFSEITSEDFYREGHKIIAAAIDNLVNLGKTADIVTVPGLLKRRKQLKIAGGHEYVSALVDGIPEKIQITEYVQTVKERSALREIMRAAIGVVQKGGNSPVEAETILDELQTDIIKISENRVKRGFRVTGDLVAPTVDLIERIQKHGESEGLKTDLTELDNMTAGFHPGDFIVIAARPSMGKTALGLNVAARMAIKYEKTVGFFSIEMSRTQILMRLLAQEARVSMAALRTGRPRLTQKEWGNLELAGSNLARAQLFIDDSPSLSIVEMKTRARRLKNERNLDIVFIDYLQLVKVGGDLVRRSDSRAQEVAAISAALKEMAKELAIPVVALAQLNRSPETRGTRRGEGPKYQLSDLKESGAIEQDADLVMFLHRDEQNDRDTERKGEADLIVAKQRNGPTGRIILTYIDKYTKFLNYQSAAGVDADFS